MRYDVMVVGIEGARTIHRKVNARPVVRKRAERMLESMSVRAVVVESRPRVVQGERGPTRARAIVAKNDKRPAYFRRGA